MAFHVQLARLRQGGGNFSVEDLRVVLVELWDRVEGLTTKPAPPAAPPAKDDPDGWASWRSQFSAVSRSRLRKPIA